MTDAELRELVRQAVARHSGAREPARRPVQLAEPDPDAALAPSGGPAPSADWRTHPSHVLYAALVNVGDACVIEPAVRCDHCGYCKSHGH